MTISAIDLHQGLRAESDLSRIAGRLSDVATSRFDVVVPSKRCAGRAPSRLHIDLGTPQITASGVTDSVIEARYTRTAWRQVAERLRIPLQYLDRLVEMENTIGPLLACRSINDLAMADEAARPVPVRGHRRGVGAASRAVGPLPGDRQRPRPVRHHRRPDRQQPDVG